MKCINKSKRYNLYHYGGLGDIQRGIIACYQICKKMNLKMYVVIIYMTKVYTQQFLETLEKRDGFKTLESPSELNQQSRIVFTCSCGKRGDKIFRCIILYNIQNSNTIYRMQTL